MYVNKTDIQVLKKLYNNIIEKKDIDESDLQHLSNFIKIQGDTRRKTIGRTTKNRDLKIHNLENKISYHKQKGNFEKMELYRKELENYKKNKI